MPATYRRAASRWTGRLVVVLLGLAAMTGCGQRPVSTASPTPIGSTATATSTPSPSTTAKPVAKGDCGFVSGGVPARVVNPPADTDVPDRGTVTFVVATNAGQFRLVLDRAQAPCAVRSFESLAEQGYFDATSCHRLIDSGPYLLTCGDPTGDGKGGPSYSFADQLDGAEKYSRGVVAMGNSGADSNGSQFFLVYADSDLPPEYTIFGRLDADGVAVVKRIAAKGEDGSDPEGLAPRGGGQPKSAVRIESVTRR